jgi:hypothetical protein
MAAIELALTRALVELKAEKARIESAISQVRTLLSGAVERTVQPRARRTRRASRKPRRIAKARVVVAKPVGAAGPKKASAVSLKLLAYVKAHRGLRMEHISKAIGVPSRKLKDVVKSLVADQQLKVRGKTRGRTYAAA